MVNPVPRFTAEDIAKTIFQAASVREDGLRGFDRMHIEFRSVTDRNFTFFRKPSFGLALLALRSQGMSWWDSRMLQRWFTLYMDEKRAGRVATISHDVDDVSNTSMKGVRPSHWHYLATRFDDPKYAFVNHPGRVAELQVHFTSELKKAMARNPNLFVKESARRHYGRRNFGINVRN